MIECDAELCQYWTGFGCVCAALGIDPDEDEGPCVWCLEDDCRGGCLL